MTMKKERIASTFLFLVTLGLTIWQTILGKNIAAIVLLGISCLASLFFTALPFIRWGCYMLKFLLRMWRNPTGFFIMNPTINFIPEPGERGKGPEWVCGFEVISTVPWTKHLSFNLEIRDPIELAGTTGQLSQRVEPLGRTEIYSKRFPISLSASEFLKRRLAASPGFLPLRVLVNAKDDKGRDVIVGESIYYVLQY